MKTLRKIPPMTHPLSKAWDQPPLYNFLIDDKSAVMRSHIFEKLHEYSTSVPSGVYEGKLWKSQNLNTKSPDYGKWYLNWWDVSNEPNKCSHQRVEILLVD